ncbi:DnaJ sub B member 13 [Rhizophlyctis rosea]|uniref:DnaJ sub B member 13 n=1 Tax=Rhizophlyctis rosea TaxID=64517 RepID=A0AAD5X2W4_9FUNG|nr:DnaJ sub B member 13 [Rhizophlyctis rosea]
MSLPPDYYKLLTTDRSTDEDGVKRAFRKMALKWHPQKNKSPEAPDRFLKICEAYDVLSDAQRRAVYDQYGVDGLKNGVPAREGYEGYPGGYQYHNNPEETFAHFFGGKNPFADFFSSHIEPTPALFGSKFGGLLGMNRPHNPATSPPSKPPATEKDLLLTLEELYTGTVKKMKVSRKVLNDDEMTTSVADKILTIEVGRGWKEGTRVTFAREGDQGANQIPADIVFIVKQIPHPTLQRDGNDLIYTADLPLVKSLTGTIIDFKTLDGRILKIPVNEIVHTTYQKVIQNEGMPISKTPDNRGNLVIRFRLKFPTYLNEEQKAALRSVLAQ